MNIKAIVTLITLFMLAACGGSADEAFVEAEDGIRATRYVSARTEARSNQTRSTEYAAPSGDDSRDILVAPGGDGTSDIGCAGQCFCDTVTQAMDCSCSAAGISGPCFVWGCKKTGAGWHCDGASSSE